MNLSAQEITNRLLMLPEQQQEVLDFIEFLRSKPERGLSAINKHKSRSVGLENSQDAQATTVDEKAASSIYQAFQQAGLIGCIETDEQLSSTYKER